MIPPLTEWFLGLDLGQRRDYSALATLTCDWTVEGRDPATWDWIRVPRLVLRDIERFPLGTSYIYYTQALDLRLSQIGAFVPAFTRREVTLVVDAGGPGAPVVDEFRRARLDLTLRPLIITGGQEPGNTSAGCLTVPRRVLLTNLILLIDHGKLVTPNGLADWNTLRDEMLDLNAATSHPNKTSSHDDMVMAVAIAAWQATRRHPALLPERKSAKAGWSPTGALF